MKCFTWTVAAAMQSCGFRSVIGTMWELNDADGPFFTREVYSQMIGELDEGEIRFKRAAEALRCAAVELKGMKDISTERWVSLIHIFFMGGNVVRPMPMHGP